MSFHVLGPDSAWTAVQHNANEASVVMMVSYRGVRFLLTGDAEGEEEEWLVEHLGDELRADVLKLGHHGSRTSSTPAFVEAVKPSLGVVSVGIANRYKHPSTEVLERFASDGVPLLRTDREGTIVVATDGKRLIVSSRRDLWILPLRR